MGLWIRSSAGGAAAIGGASFLTQAPAMVHIAQHGVAAHAGISTIASSVWKAGIAGPAHVFGTMLSAAGAASHVIMSSVGAALGISASIASAATVGFFALEAVLLLSACYLIGKSLKSAWDALRGNDRHKHEHALAQESPMQSRSMQKQMQYGQDQGSQDVHTAQVVPRAPGYARQGQGVGY